MHSQTIPPKLVCDGAKACCSCGSSESVLRANSSIMCSSRSILTENDCVVAVNLFPFGICSITGNICSPMITSWENCTNSVLINGAHAVTKVSILPCKIGGTINIVDPGQESVVIVD